MNVKRLAGGIYYFDVVAALAAVILVQGHRLTMDPAGWSAIMRDALGVWVPLLAAALLVAFRRRAYTQETPWVANTAAALAFVGIAAVFWRWNLMGFIAGLLCGSMLLLAGLVLRARRVLEPLRRHDVFGLIAVSAAVVLTLALGEVTLRLASGLFSEEIQQMLRADPRNYGVAHPYIGHLHKPNNTMVLSGRDFEASHHVDALGFRNRWPWPDRAEIVVIGDSVTFGYGVEDDHAWPYLVEQWASPRRVINLGLVGAGPQQYLRVFETFGVKLQPKLLLVGVFAQNDFWDASQFDQWLESGTGGNYMAWRDFGRPRRVPFDLRHPRYSLEGILRANVFPVVRSSYSYTLLRAIRGGDEGPAPTPPRIYRFEDGSQVQLSESDFLNKSAATQPGRREFQLLLDSLRQIHDIAARHGAHALMVLQPGKEQVHLPLLGETRGDPTSALRPALDSLGIEYLDLAPAFQARATAGERLFFEVDGHPNEAGYALISQLVIAHLKENASRYGLED